MASSNDVKSAETVREKLLELAESVEGASPEEFESQYHAVLLELQGDLCEMRPEEVSVSAAEGW